MSDDDEIKRLEERLRQLKAEQVEALASREDVPPPFPDMPSARLRPAGAALLADKRAGLGAAVLEVVLAPLLCEPGFYELKHAAGPYA